VKSGKCEKKFVKRLVNPKKNVEKCCEFGILGDEKKFKKNPLCGSTY